MLRHQQQLLGQVRDGRVVPMGPELDAKVTDALDAGGVLHLVQDAEGVGTATLTCSDSGLLERPKFHALRHGYATWLISEGVPGNVVQAVMGHEQASTTLNRYTHVSAGTHARVRAALHVPAACSPPAGIRAAGDDQ